MPGFNEGFKRTSCGLAFDMRGPRGNGLQLRRIVEELLFDDLLSLPPLVGQFLHLRERAIEPLEAEDPANDHHRFADQHRTNTDRLDRLGAPEHALLVGNEVGATDPRSTLVLAHLTVLGIELRNGLGVGVGLDPSDEAFQRARVGHGDHLLAWRARKRVATVTLDSPRTARLPRSVAATARGV